MDNTIELKLGAIEDQLKRVVRRQDEIQKSVDLLFADRQILEDLQASVQALKEIGVHNQEHQDRARISTQAGISEVAGNVEDLKSSMDNKTVIIKTTNKSIFDKFKKFFRKEMK